MVVEQVRSGCLRGYCDLVAAAGGRYGVSVALPWAGQLVACGGCMGDGLQHAFAARAGR